VKLKRKINLAKGPQKIKKIRIRIDINKKLIEGMKLKLKIKITLTKKKKKNEGQIGKNNIPQIWIE
jgi:hypothetical protein